MIRGHFTRWTKKKLGKTLSDKKVRRHNFSTLVIKCSGIRLFKAQYSILKILSIIQEIFIESLLCVSYYASSHGNNGEQRQITIPDLKKCIICDLEEFKTINNTF